LKYNCQTYVFGTNDESFSKICWVTTRLYPNFVKNELVFPRYFPCWKWGFFWREHFWYSSCNSENSFFLKINALFEWKLVFRVSGDIFARTFLW
jgi:hypothetical protein